MKLGLNRLVLIIGLALMGCQVPTSSESGLYPLPIPKGQASMTVCPMDAKICPDGRTAVRRIEPSCEFAACPRG